VVDKNVGVLIQARMGSSRLPGKSLMKLGGKPLIDHVIDRCIAKVPIEKVVVVTTDLKNDDALEAHIRERFGIQVYRGDSFDVRSRFEAVSRKFEFEGIVRVTADDPFKDPNHIQEAIRALDDKYIDYFNNFENRIFPIGLDVESFNVDALFQNIQTDKSNNSKEHVTYGLRHSSQFVKKYKSGLPEFTEIRLTIDTQSDFEFCSRLLEINPEIGLSALDWATTREALLMIKSP
jgi:spore coat polysaccharide biosynthesis protein SpsF (cytidylyltransferase family)